MYSVAKCCAKSIRQSNGGFKELYQVKTCQCHTCVVVLRNRSKRTEIFHWIRWLIQYTFKRISAYMYIHVEMNLSISNLMIYFYRCYVHSKYINRNVLDSASFSWKYQFKIERTFNEPEMPKHQIQSLIRISHKNN